MEPSARLKAIAKQVEPYQRIADIGSDHAYLPVWMIKNKKISFAIAGEIQPGPLEAARRTIREAGVEERVAARLGDGLQVVEPGEVEVAVIAGMGGAAIRGIMERSSLVRDSLSRVVCQPMTGAAGLREWLTNNAWRINAEDLVLEDGRLYEIIVAEPGRLQPLDPILYEIGPLLWQQRHPLLSEQLLRLKRQYQERVDEMTNSHTEAVKQRRQNYLEKICVLEERMKWLRVVE